MFNVIACLQANVELAKLSLDATIDNNTLKAACNQALEQLGHGNDSEAAATLRDALIAVDFAEKERQ